MSIYNTREVGNVKVVMLRGEKGEQGDVSFAQMTQAINEAVEAEATIRARVDANLYSVKADLSALNVQKERIDQIVALPDGSTTADAELVDIRIGDNGVSYPCAGDAVRTRDTQLQMNQDMLMDTLFPASFAITSSALSGYRIDGTGTLVRDDNFTLERYSLDSRNKTMKIKIGTTGMARFSTSLSASGEFGDIYTSGNEYIVTVPDDATYLHLSHKNDDVTFGAYESSLGLVKALTSSDDVDDITESGLYPVTTQNDYPQNLPENRFGLLVVFGADNKQRCVTQIFIGYYGDVYYRFRFTSNAVWGSFKQISTQMDNNAPFSYAVKAFKRIGCIGDSYTAGYIKVGSEQAQDYPEYSWVHFMEKLTGNTYTNFGVSGSSSKSWMARGNYSKLGEVEAQGNKCQAYIIGLGINDSSSDMPTKVDVGVSTDIGTDNDTFYAYYYKLILAVNAVNTDAPIFCNTCPKTGERYAPYNVAIRDIVEYCQTNQLPVYLCDLAGDKYFTKQYFGNQVFTSDLTYGHYTAVGYEMMAECMLKVLSDVIVENNSNFKTIHQIEYDS